MPQKRLSRELVLKAAMAVVDRDGLSALTMRSVAAEFDVDPMALYRYASSKDALLDGLVEVLCMEVEAAMEAQAEDQALSWRRELHEMAEAVHRAVRAHPHAIPLLATRPLDIPLARRPPAVLRINERLLTILGRAGFDDATVLLLYRVVMAWGLGYLLVEMRAMVVDPEDTDPAIRLGLHLLPTREYPRLRALLPAMADLDADAEFAAGLDALLERFTP